MQQRRQLHPFHVGPVHAILVDLDKGKIYGFFRSKKGKEEHYFEFTRKPAVKAVPRDRWRPVPIDDPRLRAVLGYAPLLSGRGASN